MPALILTVLALLLILWWLGEPYWQVRNRQRLRDQPFHAAWRDILKRRVPYVRALTADLQLQLKKHIQVFMAEKAFISRMCWAMLQHPARIFQQGTLQAMQP